MQVFALICIITCLSLTNKCRFGLSGLFFNVTLSDGVAAFIGLVAGLPSDIKAFKLEVTAGLAVQTKVLLTQ